MTVINIKSQIKNSNSKILLRLPEFVIRILEKVVQQDKMNYLLDKYSKDVGVDFLSVMLKEMNITVKVEGLDNLPDNGKCFFVANHAYGIADGLILTSIITNKYGSFKAIGNEVFMLIPQLRPLIAAVNVFGSNRREYLTELDKVFKSNIPITHFPAGLVSRVVNFKVMDSEWHKSFITKSIECERDIVPIFFYGRNSMLFYSIFMVRKAIGIKSNLELALLPHEFFNKKNKTIRVKIGKPISHLNLDPNMKHHDTAQWVKSQVYSLKNKEIA